MVKVFRDFKDNLIIDRHNPIFYGPLFRGKDGGETKKMKDLRSENSEDALTWNVFSTLKNPDPNFWVLMLLKLTFGDRKEFQEMGFGGAEVVFWGKAPPPQSRLEYMWAHPELWTADDRRRKDIERRIAKHQPLEGDTEVDVQVITKNILVLVEAKYHSALSLNTTWDNKRDQIIRNIDVGSFKAQEMALDFYFILLTPRKDISGSRAPKNWEKVENYRNNPNKIKEMLPYRKNDLDCQRMAQNVGWLHWEDIAYFLASAEKSQFNSFETYIVQQLLDYMRTKGV